MIVYFGRNYSTTSSASLQGVWTCSHCGERTEIELRGQGKGEGHAPLFWGDAAAATEAWEQADEDAMRDAAFLFELQECLFCRKRAPGSLQRAAWFRFRWSVIGALLLAIVLRVWLREFFHDKDEWMRFLGWLFVSLPIIYAVLKVVTGLRDGLRRAIISRVAARRAAPLEASAAQVQAS